MTDTWTCPSCAAQISATDAKTLAWGIDTHVCFIEGEAPDPVNPFRWDAAKDGEDALVADVALWLVVDVYKRPFVLFREGCRPLMVA